MRKRYLAAGLPALIGVVLAALAYFGTHTGVDGTRGALLALIGAVCVTLGLGVAAVPAVRGGLLAALLILIGIGAALTALAAFFLMQYGFLVAMLVALAALIAAAVMSWRESS
ncbi:MAG: hypothetical protein ABL308_10825 [Oceanicaulis sp.]